jgi:hypothetical protein
MNLEVVGNFFLYGEIKVVIENKRIAKNYVPVHHGIGGKLRQISLEPFNTFANGVTEARQHLGKILAALAFEVPRGLAPFW